jgi:hypothetical protein
MSHGSIAVVMGLPARCVERFSPDNISIGGISSLIEVLVTLLELYFGVLDGLGEILDWFRDSCLQSGLKEEQEGNEDKDVEE